jgi:phosphoglycerol transferase MdoB-like AlkP superfamily enzyme
MSSVATPRESVRVRLGASAWTILLLAKILAIGIAPLLTSGPAFVAFLWQDAAVALIVAGVAMMLRPRWLVWTIWTVFVAYVAINVPIARVLGSPLTWTMMRATGGALSDSVRHDLTFGNVMRIAIVLVAGVVVPQLTRRLITRRARAAFFVASVLVIATGRLAAVRVDTNGFDRNAITALVPRVRPSHAALAKATLDWRRSPFDRRVIGASSAQADGRRPQALRGAARGRNVVLVVLESTAAQYLEIYGAPDDPMPTLTSLAEHSLVVDAAYAAYPESVKGLYATLCGRFPLFDATAEQHATLPCTSIAQSLSARGYRTSLFHSGRFGYLGMAELLRDKGFDVLEDAGAIGGNVESSFGVDETSTVDRLLGWIDEVDDASPFFAAYLPVAGHHPYASSAPGPFTGAREIDAYKNALYDADRALARLLDGLRRRGLDRSTMLVIVGDHGEAFGQHPSNAGHTLFIYDENVRVPFVVALPWLIHEQTRVPIIASLVDVGATIRDLVGDETTATVDDGRSILEPDTSMALFFTDYARGWLGLRDGCWKYLFETDASRSKLFDVCDDPGETQDLSAGNGPRLAAYRDRLQAWASRP